MPTLPSQNPFENLFGDAGSKTQKTNTQTKSNIPKNPFEGLFEAKTEAPKIETPATREVTISARPKTSISIEQPEKESIFKKAAKVILPKKLEDFFGLNESAAYKETVKKTEEAYAAADLTRLQKELETGGGKLPKQTAGEVVKGKKPEDYLPFVSAVPNLVETVKLYQSAKRFEKGEDTLVDRYRLTKAAAEQERDSTFGAKVASVLTALPAFGGELLLTGGVYTAGKKATEKAITGTLEKALGKTAGRIVSKSAGNIVGGTLQTIPARGGEIAVGTVQNMIPDYSFTKDEVGKLSPIITGQGDDLFKAVLKSGANEWVEVVSEHSGGLFDEMAAPLKNQIFKIGVLKSFLKSNPTAKSADFMKWVNRAGWNGVVGEMFEERVGEVARGALSEFGLSDEGWKIPSKEQLAVELVSFSIPGAMISVANKGLEAGSIEEAMKKETTPAPKPITEAENIIGARDILTVGKGGTDLDAETMSKLNNKLNEYHDEMAHTAVDIVGSDKQTLATIKVVQYPDGKWGYSFEINTPENGISSNFLSNKLVKSQKEAIAEAKAKMILYARGEMDNVSDESKTGFEQVISQIEPVSPESEAKEIRYPVLYRGAKGEVNEEKNVSFKKVFIEDENQFTLLEKLKEQGVDIPEIKQNEWRKADTFLSNYFGDLGYDAIQYNNTERFAQTKENGLEIFDINTGKFFTTNKSLASLYSMQRYPDSETPGYIKKTEPTQKEKVEEAVKEKPKTIKEIAEETKILEPNVRRILGVGAKEGKFERVDKGVYILKKEGTEIAYIHTGDATEVLPKLAKDGFKADMIFLDIPYKTPAVIGGNRGIKYDYITVDQFKTVVDAVREIAREDNTPIFHMYSQAKSGLKEMQKYNDVLTDAGLVPVARGEYTKLQQDGLTQVRNMRGDVIVPEGLMLLTKSGKIDFENPNLNFKLIRPKGYQTEKPAEMLKSIIEMSTEEGDVVLDPFSGSGVTAEQAVKAGRKAVAVEKSEKAIEEHIKPRIEKAATETKKQITNKIFSSDDGSVKKLLVEKYGQNIPIYHTGIDLDLKKYQLTSQYLNRAKLNGLYFTIGKPMYEGRGTTYRFDVPVDYLLKNSEADQEDAEFLDDPKFKNIFGESAENLDIETRAWSSWVYQTKGDIDGIQIIFRDYENDGDFKMPNKYFKEKINKQPRFAKKKAASAVAINASDIAPKIIDKRPRLPILGEFKVKDGKMLITNLETSITLKSGLAEGMYRVVGKDAVKTDTDPVDFPLIPEVEDKAIAKINTSELSSALKEALSSTAPKGGARVEITGILFKNEGKKLSIVATDAYRLFMKQIPADIKGDFEFIISDPAMVQKIIYSVGEEIEISENNDFVKFSGSNGEVVERKVDGEFPDYKQIMPFVKTQYSINKSKLKTSLKELKPILKETKYNASVGITFKNGKMILTAKSETDKNLKKEIALDIISEKNIDAKISTENDGVIVMPLVTEKEGINFNEKFLSDAIVAAGDAENVNLYFGENERSPLFVSDQAEIKKQESEVKIEKKKRAAAGYASTGRASIGTFEELAGIPDKTAPELKLFEEVKNLVEKYAKSIGEGYTPRNALGVYYPGTQNIRIKGMNDVSVAAHEITHFLDFAYKISEQVMGIKGYSVNGRPIYEGDTYKLRQELSDVYEKYYPGGKGTHKLQKRMIEGFATLLQKYAEMPTTISAEFPNVVREFFTPSGKFYQPVMGDIIKDLRDLVAKYQGLPALDKIGARVIDDKVNVNKDSFLNFAQKFKTEIVDNIYPIEILAKKSGTHFTGADPSLWVRQYNNSSTLILNNLNGKRGFWGWRGGELKKLHDYNWKDLIKELHGEKITNDFGYWLVARREYFMWEELDKLKLEVERLTGEKSLADDLKEAQKKFDDAKKIIDNDGFTRKEVTDAYLQNRDRFNQYAEKYDELVGEDLKFLNDPAVGLVSNEEYNQLSSQEGYASFKRYFYDEIVGEDAKTMSRVRFGGAKVSSMLKRTGSQKPILNPLFSALTNHAEITRKGLKQIVANRIGEIADKFPDLFQRAELQAIPDAQGRFIYPQEKDSKIIMARLNYKRVPFVTDATIKRTVDEVLNFQNLSFFEKLLMGSSRFFTKGTTGLFPGFAITNYTVDQITAAAQTRNKYKVLYDPLKKIAQVLNPENLQHQYLEEYLIMGGERQTIVGWQDMTPNELFDAIGKERAGLLKAVDYINAGVNVLALPSQISEVMTRATEYIKSREAGKTQIVALEEAGRVTAPFHHIGRWGGGRTGQAYIKSIPFFNPAIQVLAQTAETLETPEGRARYAFVTLAVISASIAAMGILMSSGSDDQKKLYADLNPDELNKYIWLPNPNGKSLIKLRVPDQMEVIATLINMFWANKKLNADFSAGEYLNAGLAWLPAQIDISQPVKMFMAWIPQIIKPGALVAAGVKDYPKIMPLESQTMQNRAPEYRYTETTSPVAKWLGKQFGLSPIKIDYLLTGYLGRSVGFATGKPGIYNPMKSMSREYYFTSGRKIQSYYEAKEKNDQEYEAYKKGRKEYKFGERSAILKERAKLKAIGNTIDLYKDVDEKKNPERVERLQKKILEMIDAL